MTKNEYQKDLYFFDLVRNKRKFSKEWKAKKVDNIRINEAFTKASKNLTGYRGEPDFIYVNEVKKLLIIVENKDSISDHESDSLDKKNIIRYSVDGLIHYLDFLINPKKSSQEVTSYLENWKIIGIALSGDINHEYNHKVSTFIVKKSKIDRIDNINEILDEHDYEQLFFTYDLEEITKTLSESSKSINNLLRSLDSQNRPVLLSALMICLFKSENHHNDFESLFEDYSSQTIIDNIPTTLARVLKQEGIPNEKIEVFKDQLSFLKNDHDLGNDTSAILKKILKKLKEKVIPLFSKKSNYDIIGKFYAEFLRYAGISNVKKGIVLTPEHITTLFTDLIDIKINDVILDPCCGSGAFLIAGMNKIVEQINVSDINNKQELKNKVKTEQIIGFEKNATIYALAISNMLFRGDGKSQIFQEDFFSEKATKQLNSLRNKPTIGFINPPYGGKDTKDNPTKKEIQFLIKLLDTVSRYAIMIAPLSTYIGDVKLRNQILSKHTLKAIIHMPKELFSPNATVITAISIFETHSPHMNKEVIFYNLEDDGLVLAKSKGRTDIFGKWEGIKKDFLEKIRNVDKYQDGIKVLKKSIKNNDEWTLFAHSKTDYSRLTEDHFLKAIKNYVVFNTRRELDLLDKDIDVISMLEILNTNLVSAEKVLDKNTYAKI